MASEVNSAEKLPILCIQHILWWHRDSEEKEEKAESEKKAWGWEWDKTLQLRSEKFRKVEVGSRIALLNLGTDTKQDRKGRDREAELSNREG